jgi:hypothetical protein
VSYIIKGQCEQAH